jgi:hypothetical protein
VVAETPAGLTLTRGMHRGEAGQRRGDKRTEVSQLLGWLQIGLVLRDVENSSHTVSFMPFFFFFFLPVSDSRHGASSGQAPAYP